MINAEPIWGGWPDRGAWPGGGRKNQFLKLVKMDAISFYQNITGRPFLTSAWSGVHYGEAGGVWGELGEGAKMIKMF